MPSDSIPREEPGTLVVSADKAGHVNQCLALCEQIGWTPDLGMVRIPSPGAQQSRFERWLLNRRRKAAVAAATPARREPGRLRIVASGAASKPVVAAYRALYGADLFAVFIGQPQAKQERLFDVSIIAYHELEPGQTPDTVTIPSSAELIWMRGVLTRRIEAAAAGPRDGIGAVIGGANKAFDVDARRITEQLDAFMGASQRAGERLTLAFSRRTSQAVEARLRAAFAGSGVRFVDRSDRQGYVDLLGSAHEFVVTPDSITMVCELCATGRPVTAFDLVCVDGATVTARFFDDAVANGLVTRMGEPAAPLPAASFDVSARIGAVHRRWLEANGRRSG